MTSVVNEAEFQSLVDGFIRKFLPSFQEASISSQRNFSLKLGHHNVIVDGKEPSKYAIRGIYDLLIEISGDPLVMLELKRPGLILTEDDVRQAISYARLTDKITPITVLTNGNETLIYNTYTRKKIETEEIDNDLIQKLLRQGLSLAAEDFKNAVDSIFKSDKHTFFGVINNISSEAFTALSGLLTEYTKPICNDFLIERTILSEITQDLKNEPFQIITGEPYVGKTTLLYDLFLKLTNDGHGVLYIDCLDLRYSTFRRLANQLTKILQYRINEDQVREWLILAASQNLSGNLYVLFDNLKANTPSLVMEQITELMEIFDGRRNGIILCSDTANYSLIAKSQARNVSTSIGRKFKQKELTQFSSSEYLEANQLMSNKFNVGILWGGQYAKEYRHPRIWRLLIAGALKDKPEGDFIGVINSVPSFEILHRFRDIAQLNANVVADFKKLAKAYIENIPSIRTNNSISLMSLNMALIEESFLKENVDQETITNLQQEGLLERRVTENLDYIYIPKLPEILSAFSIDWLKEKFLPRLQEDFEKGYSEFLAVCEWMPYGEIIAAQVIVEIGQKNIPLFSDIINKMIHDNPEIERTTGERVVGLYVPNYGNLTLKINTDDENRFIANFFPFLVLSHIVALNIGDDSDDPHLIRYRMIVAIANTDFTMRRVDDILFIEGLPQHDFDGVGSFTESTIGIIEPIIQSMMFNILNDPDRFIEIIEFARQNNLYHLLHRLHLAGRGASELTDDPRVIEVAKSAENEFREIVPRMIAIAVATNKDDDKEIDEIEKRFRRLRKRQSD